MPPPRRKSPIPLRVVTGPMLRALLLGALAVAASLWAVVRYYTHPRQPMLVPRAESTASDGGRADGGDDLVWMDIDAALLTLPAEDPDGARP